MKILHVTPHLGGGVGKAHASLRGALPKEVDQIYLLLEHPRDRRYVDLIEAGGARVIIADDSAHVAYLAGQADIVQFEFWNHPRLFECLARCDFPAMRSVLWSHISGCAKPVIAPGLIEEAGRFVFTTEASLSIASMDYLARDAHQKIAVINSGFGYANVPQQAPRRRKPGIAYLGTVDFVKMHSGFFDAVDALDTDDVQISVWGEPSNAVMARAREMRHPSRIRLCGQTADPVAALSAADIFFYPLQRDHYGTAENALVEAMSLGLVPVVLNNPAEMAIVRDGETGFIARSIEECASLTQMLLGSPKLRDAMSRNAIADVSQTRTPARAAREFTSLWRGLLDDGPKRPEFRKIVGESPADWYAATQCLPGMTPEPCKLRGPEYAAKGTLAHFESVFSGHPSFSRLRL